MTFPSVVEAVSLARQLEELNRIGAALAAERDTNRLLEMILEKARAITESDAGSLYLVEREPRRDDAAFEEQRDDIPQRLRFVFAQNDSVDVPFEETGLDVTHDSIAGHVALTGEPLSLPDAYDVPPVVPYAFNRSFDLAAGYRTRSVLALPLRTPKGHIIGVLQLLNARTARLGPIDSAAAADTQVGSYSPAQQALGTTLAAQAAVALENSQLYAAIEQLFEGFVRASVVAIEARDPATSGHSFRVANLTIALAETIDRADAGRFAGVRFSRDEMWTIRYASLLHDFGKVGVREEILVKARKLYPTQLELVRERFRLARRSFEVSSMQARLDHVLAHGREAYVARLPMFDASLAAEIARLDEHLAAIETANDPTVLPDGTFDVLQQIAAVEFDEVDGRRRPLLEQDEVQLLSLRKGSLSQAERAQIESHVAHTYRFLSQIPWTPEIRRIPAIALGHHEKLNGTGYPHKLSAPDIPLQTRMMTISDIFDALSASDRPYKKAVPVERALHILECAASDGELDRDLLTLFIEARIFDRWKVEPFPY